jgi:hypothetical protein
MRIEFALQEMEYHEASRAMGSATKDWFRPLRIAGCIGAGAGFALLLGTEPSNWIAPIVLILLGLFIPIYPAFYSWRKLDAGWERFAEAGILVVEFSHESLLYETVHTSTRCSWYAFDRFMETSRLFLIFRQGQPVIVPKRALLEQQGVALLRSILEEYLSRRQPAFAVKVQTEKSK